MVNGIYLTSFYSESDFKSRTASEVTSTYCSTGASFFGLLVIVNNGLLCTYFIV